VLTELADKYPEHVLTKWLGNTPKIAKEHYLQVTEEHWRRAVTGEMKHGNISLTASRFRCGLRSFPRRLSAALLCQDSDLQRVSSIAHSLSQVL